MNEKFLDAFKELETELRSLGMSVLDYENNLADGTDKERLKLCRIIRNYLSHQDKKFAVASEEMIKFISDLALEIRRKGNVVSNELIRQKPVKSTEYLKNVLPLIVKSSVPVVDKNDQVVYLITADEYLNWLNKGIKKIELPKRLPKLNYVSKDTKIEDLLEGTYIVTSNGKIDGKYLGLCII